MEHVRGLHVGFDTEEIAAMTARATLSSPTWRANGNPVDHSPLRVVSAGCEGNASRPFFFFVEYVIQ